MPARQQPRAFETSRLCTYCMHGVWQTASRNSVISLFSAWLKCSAVPVCA